MSANRIPNVFIRWHFEALADAPELVERLVTKYEIPAEIFTSDGYQLSADQYARVIAGTITDIDDEGFLALERKLKRGSFHMMCHAVISCTTLQQAITRSLEFYGMLSEQLQWEWREEAQSCDLIFNVSGLKQGKGSYFIAFFSCIMWRWFSWLIAEPIPLQRASFAFDTPEFAEEIERIFRQKVDYQQEEHCLTFDAKYLKTPIKQTPTALKSFLINVPECLLSHYQQDLSLVKRVIAFLEQQEDLHKQQLQHVAEHFHCSEQSLIRGLRAEGARFVVLKDRIRKQRCEYLIRTTSMTNQELSQALGFSEPSVFYRQFRKWFDATPNTYRQLL